MVLKNLCIFVLWTKVASALEGLTFVMLDPHMGEPIPWDQGYCGSTHQIRGIS